MIVVTAIYPSLLALIAKPSGSIMRFVTGVLSSVRNYPSKNMPSDWSLKPIVPTFSSLTLASNPTKVPFLFWIQSIAHSIFWSPILVVIVLDWCLIEVCPYWLGSFPTQSFSPTYQPINSTIYYYAHSATTNQYFVAIVYCSSLIIELFLSYTP